MRQMLISRCRSRMNTMTRVLTDLGSVRIFGQKITTRTLSLINEPISVKIHWSQCTSTIQRIDTGIKIVKL